MKVEYYVFSGTGNTLMIAREVGRRLEEKGSQVNFHMIGKLNAFRMSGDSVIGLAFPIAFFSSYPLVLNFIASLPEGKGRSIFMTATMGGSALGAERKFRKLVMQKGYKPIGSELFVMPGNYNNGVIPAEKNSTLVTAAMEKARLFADNLADGRAVWGRGVPLIPSMWYKLVSSGRTLRFFYRMFPIMVDTDKCIKCMRCVANCPVGAIDQKGDFPTINKNLCQSCQRCVAFCPAHAIVVPGKPAEQYRAMEFEDFIS
jgi:Pyruvate/2-oxoacid:ferredoxin oxidoreductase delta subunit/flavodoxin